MIVIRFKVKSRPERSEALRAALPSRGVQGAMHFDIGQDLSDPNSFIATEVFTDRAALDRQEALAEIQKVIALLPEVLAGDPEATIYHVSSSEPWG